MNAQNTNVIVGPPGTGKTTNLLNIVEEGLARGIKPNKIGFISFTKKAAEEGKSRASERFNIAPEDLPHFRTLHSMAFKYLAMRRDQMVGWPHIRELGRMLGIAFKGRGEIAEDDIYGMNSADRMLFFEGLARNIKRPLKDVWNEAFEDEIDWWELDRFAKALDSFKKSRSLSDFTDLLERFCLSSPNALPSLDMLIIDEAQDLSLLQWDAVELLSTNVKEIYVGGDDDQCHPPDTLVLTGNRGYASIQSLEGNDTIVYWRRDTHCFHGFSQNTVNCRIASRLFDGDLIVVNEKLKTTPDHKFIIRLKDQSQDWRCVYLMRQGNNFRIGQCQLFGPENQMHLAVRMRLEKADAVWILALSKDTDDVLILEQSISALYGIPQICFENKLARRIFHGLETQSKAEKCLSDRGLLLAFPWLTPKRARQKAGGTSIMEMEACNLWANIMDIPAIANIEKVEVCKWTPIQIRREKYSGKVYSLSVPRFNTYVAEGYGIHNCIYKWAGANVAKFINLPGIARVLDVSYRIPSAVHTLADSVASRISQRRPKIWSPRLEIGSVNWFGNIEEVDLSTGTWLLLARNGYMLDELEDWCMSQGFSFNSVNRDPLKSPALAALRTWENLRKGNEESAERVLETLKFIPPHWTSITLMKKLKVDDTDRMYSMPELKRLGLRTEDVWYTALAKISDKEREFFRAALRRKESLLKEPRIKISTIHASKGGQADHVLLVTDMSYRCYNNMQTNYDDEVRVWYVAATRCRQSLNLIMPKTNLNFDF